MCRESETVRVKIPADLACEGREKWKDVMIDRCIAQIVQALQTGGINMRGSCCGHGERDGEIALQDGRTLVIRGVGAASPTSLATLGREL